jgi:hypothetical protein
MKIVIFIASAAAIARNFSIENPGEHPIDAAESITAAAGFAGAVFLALFSALLWKLPVSRWFGLIRYPNLTGTWKGTLVPGNPKFEKMETSCTITQDAWTLQWTLRQPLVSP